MACSMAVAAQTSSVPSSWDDQLVASTDERQDLDELPENPYDGKKFWLYNELYG